VGHVVDFLSPEKRMERYCRRLIGLMFARETGAPKDSLGWFVGEAVTGYHDLKARGVTPEKISAALLDFVVWRISLQTSAAQCGCCKHAYGVYCSLNQDQMPSGVCERFTFDTQAYVKQLNRLKTTISSLDGVYGFNSEAVLEGVEALLKDKWECCSASH